MSLRVPRKTCSHCLEVSKLKGIAKCCLTSHKSVRCKTFGFKKTCVLKDQQYKVLNKQTMNRFILWWKKKRETERPLAAVTSSEHVSPGVVPGFSLLLVRSSMTKVEIWLTLQNKPNQLLSQILASLCLTRNPAVAGVWTGLRVVAYGVVLMHRATLQMVIFFCLCLKSSYSLCMHELCNAGRWLSGRDLRRSL